MGPYDVVLTFTTAAAQGADPAKLAEEVNEFLKKDSESIQNLSCTVVRLHPNEAERISKKNCVAFAFKHSEEAGKLAEILFNMKNPLV